MTFHRSCCCGGGELACFPNGIGTSFLDQFRDLSSECFNCPVNGCTGGYVDDTEILPAIPGGCAIERWVTDKWLPSDPPGWVPCDEIPSDGQWHEFYWCSSNCGCQDEECSETCSCAKKYRMKCDEGTECIEGLIGLKCCYRLHIYYGAYHDGEKYWLSDNPMAYFGGHHCFKQCGACTLQTAPLCGENCVLCNHEEWDALYCNPLGCCEEGTEFCREEDEGGEGGGGGCNNCPTDPCTDPSYAPFCCTFSQRDWCSFMEDGGTDQEWWQEGYMEADCHERNWNPGDTERNECFYDYEPYYWKTCDIGGWGLRRGDMHVDRMYRIDDEEDSPTYEMRIPCNGEQDCENRALYDLYEVNEGGGLDEYVPHILIVYAYHGREGTRSELKSSYVVKGMWATCTSVNNIDENMPAPYGDFPDGEWYYPCYCDPGACCKETPGDCTNLLEDECFDEGWTYSGPDECGEEGEPCL
jgi:hypothetical protein